MSCDKAGRNIWAIIICQFLASTERRGTVWLYQAIKAYWCIEHVVGTQLSTTSAVSGAWTWWQIRARNPIFARVSGWKFAWRERILVHAVRGIFTTYYLRLRNSGCSKWEKTYWGIKQIFRDKVVQPQCWTKKAVCTCSTPYQLTVGMLQDPEVLGNAVQTSTEVPRTLDEHDWL